MALIVMPSLLSKRPWARIRARCEASFFIVLSKSARCCAVRGRTYLTIIDLDIGFTYRIVWMFYRGRYYTKKLLVEHLPWHSPLTQVVKGALYRFFGRLELPAGYGYTTVNPRRAIPF